MASESEAPPPGPDLSAGIDSTQLADETMLLGHVGDAPVLLARTNGQVYAIGATCTHYGGPLAEGLLVGDTVRCPWHHACFSLHTGEALHAPAFDPVTCYHAVEDTGRITVHEPIHATTSYAVRETPSSIVIVGAGAAGVAAAEQLRRLGYHGPLQLIDERPTDPVDRPNLSKDYLAGQAPEEWVSLRPGTFYAELGITLVKGVTVTRIDTQKRIITTSAGGEYPFDRLLLATGAQPVKLDTPGADLPHVHYLRTLDDSRSIIEGTKSATHAVVIGSSFIGLEVAASLRARGLTVHVVAPESRPLERILGPQLGDMIRTKHEQEGVVFHLEHTVTKITPSTATLSDGSELEADLVVIGVGVRPNVALAEQAGLTIDKGVVVDKYLQTSVPDIYAAGDIARWPDPHTGQSIRVEHWVVAERQGQVAARNMLGAKEPYDAVPFFWSRHFDISVDYVGHAERWTRISVDGDPMQHDCTVRYHDGDRVLAVATVGRERGSLIAELQLEQHTAAEATQEVT